MSRTRNTGIMTGRCFSIMSKSSLQYLYRDSDLKSLFWVRILKYLIVVAQFSQDQRFLLFLSVLRIRDVYSGSRILIFTQRIIEVFTQIITVSLSSQKYGFGIRDPEITYSGSRIQGSKRHRIPDPDPQHWFLYSWKPYLILKNGSR